MRSSGAGVVLVVLVACAGETEDTAPTASEPDSDSATVPDVDSESEPDIDSDTDSMSDPDSNSMSEPDSDTAYEPDTDSASDGPVPLDVESLASITITGEADWTISIERNSTVVDADGDGQLDILLTYWADDEGYTDELDCAVGPRLKRVGIVRGPLSGDHTPETWVEGRGDPLSGPAGKPLAFDQDGDGLPEVLVAETHSAGPAFSEPLDNPDCDEVFPLPEAPGVVRVSGTDLPGTFPGDPLAVDTIQIRDLDQDLTESAELIAVSPAPTGWAWWWFNGATDELTEANAEATFTSATAGDLWSRRDADGVRQTWMGEIVGPAGLRRTIGWAVSPMDFVAGGALTLTAVTPSVDVGDVTGDGLGDLARLGDAATSDTIVFDGWTDPDAQDPAFLAEFGLTFGGAVRARPAGDLNGDGAADLLLQHHAGGGAFPDPSASPEETWILLGPLEAKTYEVADTSAWSWGFQVVPLGDIDGDGKADLAFDQPGWPDLLQPDSPLRYPGRVWIVTGDDLVDGLND